MRFIAVILVALLFVIGCRSTKTTSDNNSSSTPSLTDSTVIFSFEQTACLGTCPVHKIVVLQNHYATYLGRQNVAQIGEYYANISDSQLERIFLKAEELNFFELDSIYSAQMTDMPTTIIELNSGKKNHKVTAQGVYPKNLQSFIAFLGNDLQSIVWTKVK